jgi:hypothetical protein
MSRDRKGVVLVFVTRADQGCRQTPPIGRTSFNLSERAKLARWLFSSTVRLQELRRRLRGGAGKGQTARARSIRRMPVARFHPPFAGSMRRACNVSVYQAGPLRMLLRSSAAARLRWANPPRSRYAGRQPNSPAVKSFVFNLCISSATCKSCRRCQSCCHFVNFIDTWFQLSRRNGATSSPPS